MAVSGVLQLSLISTREISCLFSRYSLLRSQCTGKALSLSVALQDLYDQPPIPSESSRRVSACTDISDASYVYEPLDDSFHGLEDSKIKAE